MFPSWCGKEGRCWQSCCHFSTELLRRSFFYRSVSVKRRCSQRLCIGERVERITAWRRILFLSFFLPFCISIRPWRTLRSREMPKSPAVCLISSRVVAPSAQDELSVSLSFFLSLFLSLSLSLYPRSFSVLLSSYPLRLRGQWVTIHDLNR